jgi:hypothetical protein
MNSLYTLVGGVEASAGQRPSAPEEAVWTKLLGISVDGWALKIEVGPIVYSLLFAAFVVWIWWNRHTIGGLLRQMEFVEAEASVFGLPKFKVRANRENSRIAYEAWVELVTRKAGLPFEEEHDTIVEVYSSWYELFGRLRLLLKTVPAYRLRGCPDTRDLVQIMIGVLNKGLRPHLTRWQAKFRRWYEEEAKKDLSKAPQEIQRGYPQYTELVNDLRQVNEQIMLYAEWLRRVAEGGKS